MKILHTADWHLGAYVGPQCDDPISRMKNTMECLNVLIRTAKEEQPDVILVSGDIFHTAKVWSDRANVELRVAAHYITVLNNVAPVIVLYGTPNHDNFEQFITLAKLTEAYFISEPNLIKIKTKSGEIQIAGLPGFDKGMFRAQFPGLSAEEENRVFTEQLDSIVQGLSAQIDTKIPSVLMAHHTVVGCSLDNGQHVEFYQQNDVVLNSTTLDNSAFDMVCLGHIHGAQRIKCSKPVYYSGSIDAFIFNDEDHRKGFWIHDTNHLFMPEFIPTPAKGFKTCTWDESAINTYLEVGMDGFHRNALKDRVVRILYSCDKATEKALDKKKLERDLYNSGAYYVSEIRSEKVTAEVNKDKLHEKLTVWDCLRNYLREKFKDKSFSAILDEAEPIISEVEASTVAGTQTGMFLPLSIELRNYRSYAAESLNFEELFFCMVNGKNGTGKSSLVMDSIVDCLYEQPRGGDITGWIKSNEKSGNIIFTFQLGFDIYRVTRTRQRSGKPTLAISKLEGLSEGIKYNKDFDFNWKDISCQKLVDTQLKIIQILGMNADTFKSCVLIMQNQCSKFMEAKSDDRMSVLANLLGLGIYEQLEENTKKLLTEVNRQLKHEKEIMSTLQQEVAELDNLKVQKSDTESAIATKQTALDDFKKAHKEASDEVVKYEFNKAKMNETAVEIGKKATDILNAMTKGNNLKNDIQQTKDFLASEAEYTAKHNELINIKNQLTAMEGTITLLVDKRKVLNKLLAEISNTETSKDKYVKELEEINSNLQKYDELVAELEELKGVEDELKFQEEKKVKFDEVVKKIAEVNGELSTCNSNISIYEQSRTKCQSELNELNNKLQEYDELVAKLEQLKGADDEVKLQEEKKTKHDEVVKKIADVCGLLSTCNSNIDIYDQQTAILRDSNCIDIDNAKCGFLKNAKESEIKLQELKKEQKKLTDEYLELEQEKTNVGYNAKLLAVVKSQNERAQDIRNKISVLDTEKKSAEKLKEQIQDLAENIKALETSREMIKTELTKLNESKDAIKYFPETHAGVKSDKERSQQLRTQIATLDSENKSAEIYKKQIEELDTKLHDINSQKTNIETEISKLEPLVINVNELIENAKILEENEKNYEQVAKAKAYLEPVELQFDEINKSIEALEYEKKELDQKYSSLKNEVDGCQKYVDVIEGYNLKIDEHEKLISELNRMIGSLDEKIKTLLSKASEFEEKQSLIKKLSEKSDKLQVLTDAFCQDGIPHQIVRDIVPDLEESANKILSQMTGGRMSLEFKTEKTQKSNENKEIPILDIEVTTFENGKLGFKELSGGQMTRCSLAVIFALAMLKASRTGMQVGMLFIDEPMGLDEEGIDGYCTALETIHNLYPDIRIVAISHDEKMKARFAQHLFIETTENGSKVRRG